jgi:hypothetical protein
VCDYLLLADLPPEQVHLANFIITAEPPPGEHERRYNLPTAEARRPNPLLDAHAPNNPTAILSEVQVIIEEGRAADPITCRDIVVRVRGPNAQGYHLDFVSVFHRHYSALHYLLFFPRGDDGWYKDLFCGDGARRHQVTRQQWTVFHLNQRPSTGQRDTLFCGRRLFQEFCCAQFALVRPLTIPALTIFFRLPSKPNF